MRASPRRPALRPCRGLGRRERALGSGPPAHAGEEPYEASLNTCYDQYKANREINANGGLSWNQSLKHLKP